MKKVKGCFLFSQFTPLENYTFSCYIYLMTIEQTVEIPPSHRLFVEVPREVPAGKAVLTYTSVLASEDVENARRIWANNRARSDDLREKLANLQGSLGKNAFGALDGVSYQRKVREEWDD